jgi:Rha family phage regulatory protein
MNLKSSQGVTMSQSSLLSDSPVSLVDGRPATTSLKIAEFFGKEHRIVMRDIRNVMDKCPEAFNAHSFVLVAYTDSKGEKRGMFTVFFDGFMLLVMGYTGKKAFQIKLEYIAAFNAMREQIEAGKKALPDPDAALSTANSPERKELQALKMQWVASATGLYRSGASSAVNRHLGIKSITKATIGQVKEAIRFVQGQIDALAVKEEPKALPEPPIEVKVKPTSLQELEGFMRETNSLRDRFGDFYFRTASSGAGHSLMMNCLLSGVHHSLWSAFESLLGISAYLAESEGTSVKMRA